MAKIEDRHRSFVVDGEPVATGVAALGDSWACTNPSVGRGATIGLLHARALRDTRAASHASTTASGSRTRGTTPPPRRSSPTTVTRWPSTATASPRSTRRSPACRYETDDPGWLLGEALANAAGKDPELLRGYLEIVSLLAHGVEVLSRPGVAERALELGATREPLPGPTRTELPGTRGRLTVAAADIEEAQSGATRETRLPSRVTGACGTRSCHGRSVGLGENDSARAAELFQRRVHVVDVDQVTEAVLVGCTARVRCRCSSPLIAIDMKSGFAHRAEIGTDLGEPDRLVLAAHVS